MIIMLAIKDGAWRVLGFEKTLGEAVKVGSLKAQGDDYGVFDLNDKAIGERFREWLEINKAQPGALVELIDTLKDKVAEMEFHAKRHMFYVNESDKLVWADPDDLRSHKEWLGADFQGLRGYRLGSEIFFYKGDKFEGDEDGVWRVIKNDQHLNVELRVWSGVKVGKVGEQWPGDKYLGTVGEIRDVDSR